MADRHTPVSSPPADRQSRPEVDNSRRDYSPYAAQPEHHPSWTDGFPHSFHGWGPLTPDLHADEPDRHTSEDEHYRLSNPEGGLIWRDRGGTDDIIVWRLNGNRH